MKEVEFWRWRHRCPLRGVVITTRHHATEEDARAQWPDAEKVEGSRIVRLLPEGPHEWEYSDPSRSPGWKGPRG